KNKKYDASLTMLEEFFVEARQYDAAGATAPNPRLAALNGVFSGEQRLYLHADYGKDIVEAVKFAERHGVQKPVVVGGMNAAEVSDFLVEHDVPVIVSRIHALPMRPEDDVDYAYRVPKVLHDAGVRVALDYSGDMEQMGARNLPFLAGTAAAYGVDPEVALQMVTLHPAEIMGVADRVGSLEAGKDATLVVSRGDLLDPRGNDVTHAFIGGRKVALTSKHVQLYEQYRAKYGQPAGSR
ncbi:MAG: amidohydrolase family protein, partial [Catalinimonas sp.]